MSFFDLDPTASANLIDRARLNPIDPESMKPGWFAGAWKAPVTGLASVVNDAALLAGDAATPFMRAAVRPVDELLGTKAEDWLVKEQQKAVDNIKEWAPDPRTTGVVGQVVHGLFNVVPEVAAGGPETAALLQGYKGMRAGMSDGLDPGTAFTKGAIDGISTWVGLKIPMTLAPQLGAAANVGEGAKAATEQQVDRDRLAVHDFVLIGHLAVAARAQQLCGGPLVAMPVLTLAAAPRPTLAAAPSCGARVIGIFRPATVCVASCGCVSA